MYSPDGFASLTCLLYNECSFLSFQAPFVELMKLMHGNYVLFFCFQAIVWFALIGSIYFLAKTMNVKHLFLTPFFLIFGSTLFIDNYVGSFENDYIAIVLFIIAIIFWIRESKVYDKWISLALVGLGSTIWFWFAYFRLPLLFAPISEMIWWVQIFAWGVLTPFYLLGVMSIFYGLKNNRFVLFSLMILVSFCFPKLWFLSIPMMLKVIDTILSEFEFKPNYQLYMKYIIFALILGQALRVGINTFQEWNVDTDSTKCFTVDHEYLARVKGISLYYNQAPIDTYNNCLKQEALLHGK